MATAPDSIFRTLVPVNRLGSEAQQRLWKMARIRSLTGGQTVFARDARDDEVHFLLDGEVDYVDQGRFLTRVGSHQRLGRRPLDGAGPKRFLARAAGPCTVAILPRAELERATEATRLTGHAREFAANELVAPLPGDWVGEIMNSALFQVLPSDTIQQLFGALETLDRHAGETVFRQGDPGDCFYIVESGYCEVVRRAGGGRQEIHVVDLRPGDTFGEAAVISGHPRDASVIALTDARLHRLAKADFDRLVRQPLVHPLSVAGAREAVAAGARWLDIGDPEIYAKAPLRNSRNIPLNALRVQSERLARDATYLVCCDDPALSAVGAYVLAERGFRVFYLSDPIVMVLGGTSVPTPTADRIGDNVVAFPGPAAPSATEVRETSRGATMDMKGPPEAPAGAEGNTLERADRRVTQQEFEAAARTVLPLAPAQFADTHTGATLASLIADIDARKQDLAVGDGRLEADIDPLGVDESGTEFIDFDELEASALGAAAAGLAAAAVPPPATLPGDPVAEMVHDLEARLRAYVETNLMERTLDVERRYRQKVVRLQEQAQARLRQRDAELKAHYAAQFRRKDQALRENYQKLMTLATKISQQKAQLQAARRQFEEKLKAANAVYKQVEDMRRLLGEHVGAAQESPDLGQRQSAR